MRIKKPMKVFLGGTCPSDENDFDYRSNLIPILKKYDVNYFNPVVEDWTIKAIAEEELQKQVCDVHLYLIAPNMKGVYSIAECFGSLIKNKNAKVVFAYIVSPLNKGNSFFNKAQIKSLEATENLLCECGGCSFGPIDINEDNEDFVDLVSYMKEVWK